MIAARSIPVSLQLDPQGLVWWGDARDAAESTCMGAEEFAASGLPMEAGAVRLLGTVANAPLIEALGRHHPDLRVYLGSPLKAPLDGRHDPECVLSRLRNDTGGWHRLNEAAWQAYRVTARVAACGVDAEAVELFKAHPAYAAASFVPGHDVVAACRLAAAVVDPRWFTDPRRPDRVSRVATFLGVNPSNAQARYEGTGGGRHAARFSDVLGAWYDRPGLPVKPTGPSAFLWRVHAAAGGGPKGLLKASRCYLRFLVSVWSDRTHGRGEGLFDADLFFSRDVGAADAYRQHLSSLTS
jgi:hypothetical protein